jgi:hypothetical protein
MSIASVAARALVPVAAVATVVLALAGCAAPHPIGRVSGAADSVAVAELPEPPATSFDPGLIVSDDSFYDSSAMTEDEIQAFLEGVDCRPRDRVPCLADYKESTVTQPAAGPGHCTEYRGSIRERASRIIAKAAAACGISPKTLLVLLQKEQSLVTRPSESGYLRAMGYGCPDTADCDADYFGFFNQVYNAAWQFRQYTEEPDRQYHVGAVDVQFHPDAACGASRVEIANQATANLYNYTPYQPNAATIADPRVGDDCSAFGNLNFWRIWHRWFGDPLHERFPGFLPPCSRLVGGHACPIPAATLPAVTTPRTGAN